MEKKDVFRVLTLEENKPIERTSRTYNGWHGMHEIEWLKELGLHRHRNVFLHYTIPYRLEKLKTYKDTLYRRSDYSERTRSSINKYLQREINHLEEALSNGDSFWEPGHFTSFIISKTRVEEILSNLRKPS